MPWSGPDRTSVSELAFVDVVLRFAGAFFLLAFFVLAGFFFVLAFLAEAFLAEAFLAEAFLAEAFLAGAFLREAGFFFDFDAFFFAVFLTAFDLLFFPAAFLLTFFFVGRFLATGFLRETAFFFAFFDAAFFLVTLAFLPVVFFRETAFFEAAFLRAVPAFLRFLLAVFFAGIFDSCRSEKNAGLYIGWGHMEAQFPGLGRPAPPAAPWGSCGVRRGLETAVV